mmetsp:Transcript_85684/g.239445  ORF Transcript_85684/g.239445 Transcript_85684/m.239445 type:complete len:323 (+) Transcript_85684:394-1362(+)
MALKASHMAFSSTTCCVSKVAITNSRRLITPPPSSSIAAKASSTSTRPASCGCALTQSLSSCKLTKPSPPESIFAKTFSSVATSEGNIFSAINCSIAFLNCDSFANVARFSITSYSTGAVHLFASNSSLSHPPRKSCSGSGRCFGSFASNCLMSCRASLLTLLKHPSMSGSECKILSAREIKLRPWNGNFPLSNWKRITPTDHTSLAMVFLARSDLGSGTSLTLRRGDFLSMVFSWTASAFPARGEGLRPEVGTALRAVLRRGPRADLGEPAGERTLARFRTKPGLPGVPPSPIELTGRLGRGVRPASSCFLNHGSITSGAT